MGCSYEKSFLVVFPLNREKKILFPCIHIQNISQPGRDFYWRLLGGKILRDANIQNG